MKILIIKDIADFKLIHKNEQMNSAIRAQFVYATSEIFLAVYENTYYQGYCRFQTDTQKMNR